MDDLPASIIVHPTRGQLHHTNPLVPVGFQHPQIWSPPPPGPQEPFGLDDFHDSLLEKIISFMDAESVLLTSQTCKRLHRMCEREVVWEHLVCSRFGHRQNRTIVSSERHFNEEDGLRFVCIQRMSWKMVYKKHREVLFALFRGNSAGKVQSVGGEWFVNHANELALPSLA
mmetsp:Transcript_4439/g.13526  ORF Transcript_4439/g.13526 Transcript_4439/m.13526 type:complete len:171 (-) Transcript_4439:100-612(-)